MLSLAQRHESRAQRIADNAAEFNGGTTGSIGTATLAYTDFVTAFARLSPEEQDRFNETRQNLDEQFDGNRSLSEAPDGSGRTMAGIGVINTGVVPASVIAAEQGNGGGTDAGSYSGEAAAGWGATPPVTVDGLPAPSFDPEQGNLAGQSLEAQGATDAAAADKAAVATAKAADKAAKA